jgi:hypothetical protein
MAYLLIGIALYSISIFWIGVADPWINAQFEEQRRDRAGREEEREEETKQEERPKVGDFLKFVFPIIRRTAPSLIAQSIVSVQPMTGPVGGVAFYRSRYGRFGAPDPDRTVLDDIVDSVANAESDPAWIVEDIMRSVFKDNPYSRYHPDYREDEYAGNSLDGE